MENMIKCYTYKIYMLVECTFVNYGGGGYINGPFGDDSTEVADVSCSIPYK